MVDLEARGSIPRGETFCCFEYSDIVRFWCFTRIHIMLPSFNFFFLLF